MEIGSVQAARRDSIEKFQYKAALAASQSAIDTKISDWRLTDAKGRAFSFSELLGKPLIISPVYTSCYAICPTTTRHLATVVEKARESLGVDSFSIALLGFDHRFDSPQTMAQFAKKQGIEDAGWHLLSADEKTINGLTDELGFEFFTSPNGFDHIVQTSIIDSGGVIYRQVYGEVFPTQHLVEPLKELVLGIPKPNQTLLSELVDKIRFFCTSYDPARDAYFFDYSLFVGMLIGGLIMIFTVVFVVREHLKNRRRYRT
jgi:protein SCO1/2